MEELLKFKRITKYRLVNEIFFISITAILIGILAHSEYIAIIIILDFLLGLGFEFTVDRKVKFIYSIPIYMLLHLIFCILIYLIFSANQLELFNLGLSRFLLPTILFISGFGAIHRIKIPPFVHNGYFTINDARQYTKKIIFVILAILVGLLFIVLVLSWIL